VVYVKKLLKEAYANSLSKVKDESQLINGKTLVKSISPIRKRPGGIIKKQGKS